MHEEDEFELLEEEAKESHSEEEGVGHGEEEQQKDGYLDNDLEADQPEEEVGGVGGDVVVVAVVVERAVHAQVQQKQHPHRYHLIEAALLSSHPSW